MLTAKCLGFLENLQWSKFRNRNCTNRKRDTVTLSAFECCNETKGFPHSQTCNRTVMQMHGQTRNCTILSSQMGQVSSLLPRDLFDSNSACQTHFATIASQYSVGAQRSVRPSSTIIPSPHRSRYPCLLIQPQCNCLRESG